MGINKQSLAKVWEELNRPLRPAGKSQSNQSKCILMKVIANVINTITLFVCSIRKTVGMSKNPRNCKNGDIALYA